MSSFFYRYAEYLQEIYTTLIFMLEFAAFIVVGWYLLEAIYAKNPLRSTYEKIYLAFCGGIYLLMLVTFTR